MIKVNLADALSVKEASDCILYKVSHNYLASYCKSTEFFLSELSESIKYNDLSKASLILYSMQIGLGFVLEDIIETERKINTT